jgi:hypothetical protein
MLAAFRSSEPSEWADSDGLGSGSTDPRAAESQVAPLRESTSIYNRESPAEL